MIYKDYDNSAPAAEPEPFNEAQSDVLSRVIAMERDCERDERDKAIAPLKQEIAEPTPAMRSISFKCCSKATDFDLGPVVQHEPPRAGDRTGQ
jgi:hypothetical protein